jgi:hypothetical protein
VFYYEEIEFDTEKIIFRLEVVCAYEMAVKMKVMKIIREKRGFFVGLQGLYIWWKYHVVQIKCALDASR